MRPERGIEEFFGAVRTELHSMGLGEGSAIPGPAEGTGRSTTSAKSFSYAKTLLLVRNSSPHSRWHAATYRYLAVPRVLVSS
jgi:hypothetical protein